MKTVNTQNSRKLQIVATLILVGLFGIQSLASNHGSDWSNIGPDARTMGMGGARVAAEGDAYSTYWNPAALQRKQELASTYATLQNSARYNYLGCTMESPIGRLGFSYISTGIDGFQKTSYIQASSTGHGTASVIGDDFSVGNSAVYVSWAENLGRLAGRDPQNLDNDWSKRVEIGATFKLMSQYMGASSASGFGVDAGVQYQVNPELRLGGVVYNLLSPVMSWNDAESDTLATRGKLGLSFNLQKNLLLVADADVFGYKRGGSYVGGEYQVNTQFTLRGGYQQSAFSVGVGVNYMGAKFDFAYTQASADYMDASTRLSLGYVFGPSQEKHVGRLVKLPAAPVAVVTPAQVVAPQITEVSPVESKPELQIVYASANVIPTIEVDLPENKVLEVEAGTIGIRGKVELATTFEINKDATYVQDSGYFFTVKSVKTGLNKFTFTAKSLTGDTVTIVRNVRGIAAAPKTIIEQVTLKSTYSPVIIEAASGTIVPLLANQNK